MDMCGPALAIGQAIGRMGCQLAGDGDWGLVSNVPWAMGVSARDRRLELRDGC